MHFTNNNLIQTSIIILLVRMYLEYLGLHHHSACYLQSPDHLNSFAHAHIIVVKVQKSGQAEDGNDVPRVVNPGHELLQIIC